MALIESGRQCPGALGAALFTVGAVVLLLAGPAFAAGPDIDLCRYRQSFAEDFHGLSVSSRGEHASRWVAHTPWNGDFGEAAFADPEPGFPFKTNGGVLSIEARKAADGKWRSGLLASANAEIPGGTNPPHFIQLFGYFEIRAKLPAGPGLWPAFWLSTAQPAGATEPSVEIDILEHYGQFPGDFHSVLHIWDRSGADRNKMEDKVTSVTPGSLYDAFHTYGADVESDLITFYFDRHEIWQIPRPPEYQKPVLVLLDLALGGGWPIDRTPNPSVMEVDYVRIYQRETDGGTQCP
ncbi:MAG: glycoside hydrolase family 16 protein [Alphaproteobacteria bacterium]|nr:glycoside hydrolase family 16 protein [Alphaproteobacteria bacterium]MBV9860769.1 glycoside hydrolase family 16 protein [Alphaproteobacteria bacterium]